MSAAKTRIMYVEHKVDGLKGPARVGRVRFSKTGRSIYYKDLTLKSLSGAGFKANYFDAETGDEYWISGCRKDGNDTLYPGVVEIDEEVREAYWTEIRGQPDKKHLTSFRSPGKHPAD